VWLCKCWCCQTVPTARRCIAAVLSMFYKFFYTNTGVAIFHSYITCRTTKSKVAWILIVVDKVYDWVSALHWRSPGWRLAKFREPTSRWLCDLRSFIQHHNDITFRCRRWAVDILFSELHWIRPLLIILTGSTPSLAAPHSTRLLRVNEALDTFSYASKIDLHSQHIPSILRHKEYQDVYLHAPRYRSIN